MNQPLPETWPTNGLSFGGDYNPEQWPRETWKQDVSLMRLARVNLVTLGVFSWGLLEPEPMRYDWDWFDEIITLLHEAGISINLATPTAAPPSWLLAQHPEILVRDAYLQPAQPGHRLGWCPSSPVFREHALRIAQALAQRYGSHPAVRLWHISNEIGGGNMRCYCPVSAARFRGWLQERFGTIDAVNTRWGTAFWGHRYNDFDEVLPPRGHRDVPNPGLFLDFERFSSDELLRHYLAERQVVRRHTSAPVTTNFMVSSGAHVVDYADWVRHVDIAANDHYTDAVDPDRAQELAFAADRMRCLSGRRPWLLMEHAAGASSWQRRNRAKEPGEILRNALSHVARGSDGAMFFQWRASTAGAEQFHSAMVPHAGTQTRVWREIVQLGTTLQALAPIAGGSVEPAQVALMMDDQSAWALQQGLKPHRDLSYAREPRAWHAAFWRRQVLVDVLPADAELQGYHLLIVPTLYVVDDECAERVRRFARAGGTVLVTYLSGIVDQTNRVREGGYPGAFRDLLGVWAEEFRPLQADEAVTLDDGTVVRDWSEDTVPAGATTVLAYASGPGAGRPAVTRQCVGHGSSWYVSAQLPQDRIDIIADRLIDDLDLTRTAHASPGIEAIRRHTDSGPVLFLINHQETDETVDATGTDVVSGKDVGPSVVVPGRDVRILWEQA